MKLKPRQLASHLSDGVHGIYLVSGNEPLLVDETLEAIRDQARRQGYDERETNVAERGFDWEKLDAGLRNFSLFASRRIVEVRLPTGRPGDKGSRKITALTEAPPGDTVLLFITPRLDRNSAKSKWATMLARHGVWIDLRAPDHTELPRWLAGRLKRAGLDCDQEALEYLAARVEGNLLAAKQEIDKLVLLAGGKRVTLDVMRQTISDGARYDVFQLGDAALAGDVRRSVQILRGLEREGVAAPLALWALAREAAGLAEVAFGLRRGLSLPRAMHEAGIWRNRQELVGTAARRFRARSAQDLLEQACHADRVVKGARNGQPWAELMRLALAIAGTTARPVRAA